MYGTNEATLQLFAAFIHLIITVDILDGVAHDVKEGSKLHEQTHA